MPEHADFPRLCRTCELEAHSNAASNPSDSHVIQICRHARVVAVGLRRQQGGEIRSWHMEGPNLSDDEIDALSARLLATFTRLGMALHHRPPLQ